MKNGRSNDTCAGQRLAAETTAVVLAGGEGSRLGSLTRSVCKPALPFGASYRNIDFTLSNCVNSGIRRIGVATQHKPDTLVRHLDEAWSDVARRRGEFLSIWSADVRAPLTGYRGTADAVFRNLESIERHDGGLVLVLAGDHVYQMDYRPMLLAHRLRQADVTVGCFEVPAGEASQFGVVAVGSGGLIERFAEKPKHLEWPTFGHRATVSMGIYVFDAGVLARELRRDAASIDSHHDFGRDILPRLVGRANALAYTFKGREDAGAAYWRDVGTPAAYWQAHMDLLDGRTGLRLDDASWPIRFVRGKPMSAAGAAYMDVPGARQSLIAPGCSVTGELHRSVLFSGVRIGSGSRIEDSVVLPGAVIGRNCHIAGAVVDSGCRIPDDTLVAPSAVPDRGNPEPVVLTVESLAPQALLATA